MHDTPQPNNLQLLVALNQAQIPQCGTVDSLQYIRNHLYRFCSLSSPACTLLNLLFVSKCSISFVLLRSPCEVLSPKTSTHWVFSYKLCNHHNFLYGTLWHFIAISLILVLTEYFTYPITLDEHSLTAGIVSYSSFSVPGPAQCITYFA